MYDHEDELLARVVLDIGETFFAEGEKLDIEGQLNDALQHFNWSRLMFERSEKTSNRRDVMKNEIEKTNKRINDLEKRLQSMDDTT
ncbi:hypothetical protein I4U23_012471 [Adineta vaga]|nr:hypothetical protein I4U23_012471 [Adineta vaga]